MRSAYWMVRLMIIEKTIMYTTKITNTIAPNASNSTLKVSFESREWYRLIHGTKSNFEAKDAEL